MTTESPQYYVQYPVDIWLLDSYQYLFWSILEDLAREGNQVWSNPKEVEWSCQTDPIRDLCIITGLGDVNGDQVVH